MAWTSAARRQRRHQPSSCLCVAKNNDNKNKQTFESSGRVFQLHRSVVQQLPPPEQVLFGKHLATLHSHDGLAVSATERHILIGCLKTNAALLAIVKQ